MADNKAPPKDVIRILVSTDNHLGYLEKDPIRGEDSFRTFEEIFRIAKAAKVDLVLLGGDLFHENKPSRSTFFKAGEILRKHCLGDDPVHFEIVSDQSINFPDTACVNYENPNYNISLPIFSIHGNHDDPMGMGSFSALDLLGQHNLVNYFGKAHNINDIKLFPILMHKGSTKLALYGLGSVREERLHRTFQSKKVQWVRPLEDKDSYFNLFVLHQNRLRRNAFYKNSISESMLPAFLDFVVWGHEHECLIDPVESVQKRYFVTQPGSSIATSLSQGETVPKHVGILEIKGDQYRMIKKKLQTVRPFKMQDVVLSELNLDEEDVEEYLQAKVEEIIESVKKELGFEPEEDEEEDEDRRASQSLPQEMLPLIRIRVDHNGYRKFSSARFGQKFVGKVANPEDILLFSKKQRAAPKKTAKDNMKSLVNDMLIERDDGKAPPIHELIVKHLTVSSKPMDIVAPKKMNDALQSFVNKFELDAMEDYMEDTIRSNIKSIIAEADVATTDRIDEILCASRPADSIAGGDDDRVGMHDSDAELQSKSVSAPGLSSSSSPGRKSGEKRRGRGRAGTESGCSPTEGNEGDGESNKQQRRRRPQRKRAPVSYVEEAGDEEDNSALLGGIDDSNLGNDGDDSESSFELPSPEKNSVKATTGKKRKVTVKAKQERGHVKKQRSRPEVIEVLSESSYEPEDDGQGDDQDDENDDFGFEEEEDKKEKKQWKRRRDGTRGGVTAPAKKKGKPASTSSLKKRGNSNSNARKKKATTKRKSISKKQVPMSKYLSLSLGPSQS